LLALFVFGKHSSERLGVQFLHWPSQAAVFCFSPRRVRSRGFGLGAKTELRFSIGWDATLTTPI
jgi:hypothetical protein